MAEDKLTFAMAENDPKEVETEPGAPVVFHYSDGRVQTHADPEDPAPDKAYVGAALTWAVELSEAIDSHCPVCNADFSVGDLRGHIKTQHLTRVLVGYAHKDLDAVFKIAQEDAVADAELFDNVGLEIDSESEDHYNSFEVDADLQRSLTADGSKLHWASPRQVSRYKRRGMEIVGGLASDGTFKGPENQFGSGEMILMRIPAKLVEIRARVKERNVDSGIYAKQEDRAKRIEGIQRKTHDTLAKRGYGADQIKNVVRAVGRGLEQGVLRVRNQKGNRQYSV